MSIEITIRHMEKDAKLNEYIEGKAEALMEDFPHLEHVHVIVNQEKHRFMAEVVVQGRPHARCESAETSDKVLISIDAAFTKMEKQLRKLTEKVHDHKTAMKHGETQKRKS